MFPANNQIAASRIVTMILEVAAEEFEFNPHTLPTLFEALRQFQLAEE